MKSEVLLRLLNVSYPIIQAPMAGVSTPALAAAVSNAGALGSLGVGASNVTQARAMIAATEALTSRPFNVNVFCNRRAVADARTEQAWLTFLTPYFEEFAVAPPTALSEIYKTFLHDPEMLELFLQEKPAVVSFHFGLPPDAWIQALRSAGIATLACVTTPEEARLAAKAGVDALVAQGAEAGGHRGTFDVSVPDRQLGTFALIPLVKAVVDLPVIAAGGIMNGAGISAALALGASGVQLGTAFILCPESSANEAYRAAFKSERVHRTQITHAISGRSARGMANRIHTDLLVPNAPAVPDYPIAYDALKALSAAAAAAGNHDFAVQWAGQGAPLARALPAAALVSILVEEAGLRAV